MDQQMISEVNEVMMEMSQDIRCDIHGDIWGHDRWAEEIVRLRAEIRSMKEKAIEDSWVRNPDRSGGQFTDEEINRSREGGAGNDF
jgi:hypothetical protein